MTFKIVSDSSADMLKLDKVPFASVPLTIRAGEQIFVDDASCDPAAMTDYMLSYKGKSSTACPGTQDWLDAFGDAEAVFCVTLTSNLSGSYNSARVAAEEYTEAHPGRRVHVVDTLSAGPELRLVVEKLQALILAGTDFDTIVREIEAYHKRCYLVFSLQSLHNFVANGRVSPAVGALVGLLGIRVVGRASEVGTLEPLSKVRGDRKALPEIIDLMKKFGWTGGKIRIAHNDNEQLASAIRDGLKALHEKLDVAVYHTRGLCSYYAERGGVLVGFEGA
ncbi:MAG: DegV family protein [Clostridia bacterium]|nr:DegV family protein [Clostridia bacterium]